MARRGARTAQDDEPFNYAAQFADPIKELTLPSGNKVRVRTPDLPALGKRGVIPNHLLPIVEKFIISGAFAIAEYIKSGKQDDGSPPGDVLMKYADFNEYVDYFCVAAVVEPPLSLDGEGDTLPVSWLSRDERFAIWDWGSGLTAALAAFPGDGAGPVEPVAQLPDGGEVRDDAEPDAGADAS